jgi:hypothetical protein
MIRAPAGIRGYGRWPVAPVVLFTAFFASVGLTALWTASMVAARDAVRPVHVLILLAVALKALSVLMHGAQEVALSLTDSAPHLSWFWYV